MTLAALRPALEIAGGVSGLVCLCGWVLTLRVCERQRQTLLDWANEAVERENLSEQRSAEEAARRAPCS